MHLFPHDNSHLDAGERIFLDTFRLGVTEENQDGIADLFVDCSAIIECDLRHLGEIVVKQLS